MADKSKPAAGNFKRPGWAITEKKLNEAYVKVTEFNRKSAIVTGRVLYIFRPEKNNFFSYGGFMEVWPKLKRGMIKVSSHPVLVTHEFFATEDMNLEDYKSLFEPLLTKKISEGIVYINRNDKLVKYEKV